MACYSVQKYGFTTISEMMIDIVAELTTTTGALVSAPHFVEGVSYTIVDVGSDPTDFTLNSPGPALDNVPGTTFTMGATPLAGNGTATILKDSPYFDKKFGDAGTTGAVILESNIAIDPLAQTVTTSGMATSSITGAWRLCFNQLNDWELGVHAATAMQLQDDGTIAHLNDRGNTVNLVPNSIATSGTTGTVTVTVTFPAQTPTGVIPFLTGSSITMSAVLDERYNGNFTVLVGTTTTVTYSLEVIGGLPLLAATVKGFISTRVKKEPAGNIGADWTGPNGVPSSVDSNQIWLNRTPDIGSENAYPLSYALSLTNRGIFLGVWQDSQEEIPQVVSYPRNTYTLAISSVVYLLTVVTVTFAAASGVPSGTLPFLPGSIVTLAGVGVTSFNGSYTVITATATVVTFSMVGIIPEANAVAGGTISTVPNAQVPESAYGRSPFRWFLIQRSVDRLTGNVRGSPATANTSRCPVYCISGTGVPSSYRKFVVRERDVVSPSRKKYAAVPSEDTTALLNPYPQQSMTESGEFVVTFVNNLTTSRYKYADELDMMGTVSAEVIGAGTSIDVNVYNEAETRRYTAVYANQQYGTGMRLMVLTAVSKTIEDSHLV